MPSPSDLQTLQEYLKLPADQKHGLVLRDADLRNVKFCHTRMNGVTLDNAIITGADFSNAQICFDTNEAIKYAFAHPRGNEIIYDESYWLTRK